jgi:hypothetical protein
MRVCLRMLERNFDVEGESQGPRLPPLLANLDILMKDLSRAADFVFR